MPLVSRGVVTPTGGVLPTFWLASSQGGGVGPSSGGSEDSLSLGAPALDLPRSSLVLPGRPGSFLGASTPAPSFPLPEQGPVDQASARLSPLLMRHL